jgi:hypothetical protein
MRRLHLAIGLAGLVAFLATGAFMRLHHPALVEIDGGTRMLYRSRHVYLLLSGLLNLALGTYSRLSERTWRRGFQSVGSCLVLAAPPLLLAAFVREPRRSDPGLPYTAPAIVALSLGTLLHAVGGAGPGATGRVAVLGISRRVVRPGPTSQEVGS